MEQQGDDEKRIPQRRRRTGFIREVLDVVGYKFSATIRRLREDCAPALREKDLGVEK
jgi:hypothetical protein